jgi:hypothetical protein
MTRQQIIEEIKQLSVAERVALIEVISRGLSEELGAGGARLTGGALGVGSVEAGGGGPDKVSLSRQLYGALKFDGPAPIDEELKDIIAAHLLEKHS